MAKISLAALGVVTALTLVVGCGKDEPPPATPAPQQPVYGQPQPGQPGYQPQPGQPGYGQQPGQPGAPVPGQMATPGPTAMACQNDGQCLTHRCNLQFQKCAFPCVSDADCIQGSTCLTALGPAAACVPKPPGAQ
jgi:hypothetical protein